MGAEVLPVLLKRDCSRRPVSQEQGGQKSLWGGLPEAGLSRGNPLEGNLTYCRG